MNTKRKNQKQRHNIKDLYIKTHLILKQFGVNASYILRIFFFIK